MIYLILPIGNHHGWGVCGKNLTIELSKMDEVKLITRDSKDVVKALDDELDSYLVGNVLLDGRQCLAPMAAPAHIYTVDSPILQCIEDYRFEPYYMPLDGTKKIGYTFIEKTFIPKDCIEKARQNFDIVVAGSKWCEEMLREHGLENVVSIPQGVNPQIFNPYYSEKDLLKDKFVIFSGGKFGFRKGQDIVIKAFKIMQDKYPDVMLMTSWGNFWPGTMANMEYSSHIDYVHNAEDDSAQLIERTLLRNGIDMDRVIQLGIHVNSQMAKFFKNTDIGLFPNRCEGGTNLVMMEYMACGKPVIASYNTGHKDIISEMNSLTIHTVDSEIKIKTQVDESYSLWPNPCFDQIMGTLEWAYHHRDDLDIIGKKAGRDLRQFTWEDCAKQFYALME